MLHATKNLVNLQFNHDINDLHSSLLFDANVILEALDACACVLGVYISDIPTH